MFYFLVCGGSVGLSGAAPTALLPSFCYQKGSQPPTQSHERLGDTCRAEAGCLSGTPAEPKYVVEMGDLIFSMQPAALRREQLPF